MVERGVGIRWINGTDKVREARAKISHYGRENADGILRSDGQRSETYRLPERADRQCQSSSRL